MANPQTVTTKPVLALWGTNDRLTRDDSNKSVQGSLKPFLPNLKTVPLQGGNHFGILSENVVGPLATEDLDEELLTPSDLQRQMVDEIALFCGW